MLGIRIGLGWAKSHCFHTGQCPVMKYNRQLMHVHPARQDQDRQSRERDRRSRWTKPPRATRISTKARRRSSSSTRTAWWHRSVTEPGGPHRTESEFQIWNSPLHLLSIGWLGSTEGSPQCAKAGGSAALDPSHPDALSTNGATTDLEFDWQTATGQVTIKVLRREIVPPPTTLLSGSRHATNSRFVSHIACRAGCRVDLWNSTRSIRRLAQFPRAASYGSFDRNGPAASMAGRRAAAGLEG